MRSHLSLSGIRVLARKHLFVIVPMLLTAAMLARHLTFVPMWDGRTYFESLRSAVRAPFNPLNFNIFGHPTMLFMLWAAIGQFIDPGNAVLLNLSQLVLAVIGVWAFAGILERLFPGESSAVERLLGASIFAVFPVVLAAEQNFNPDTGVMVFLLLYLRLLLEERYGAALAAALFLVESKESGVLLYAIVTLLFMAAWWRDANDLRAWGSMVLRRTRAFAPLFFYAGVALLSWSRGRSLVWRSPIAAENQRLLRRLIIPDPHDLTRLAYGAGIWVINFGWVLTLFIIVGAAKVGWLRIRKRSVSVPDVARRPAAILLALFLLASIALTRFSTFANLRYLLPIYPFVLIAFLLSIRLLFRRKGSRTSLTSAVLVLFAISSSRTVDPVSRAIYGTFPFGRHRILTMTSLTGECCGYGRDQLVYNLEYVHLASIQNRIYADIRPNARTAIVKDGHTEWYFDGPLDPATFRRTLRIEGSMRPRYMITSGVLESRNPPEELYYVAYPNVDNVVGFERLRSRYHPVGSKNYEESGYSIRVTHMRRRAPA